MKRTSRMPKRTSRNPSKAKLIRFPEGVMTEEDWVAKHAVRVEERTLGSDHWHSLIDRRSYNRMDNDEQRAYEARLRAKAAKPAYRAWTDRDTFYDVSKATFESAPARLKTPKANSRLTESQRSKLPPSVFVFPERRTFPLESEAAAYDAIRMLRLGRVKSASDFKEVADAIREKYPSVWKQYGTALSWPKVKAAKALGSKHRAATVAAKKLGSKRTSRLAANPEAKLDKRDRAAISKSLVRAGLDGNGRFRSVGMALSAASGVLGDHGLEPDEVLSAWKFQGQSGSTQIRVARINPNDPFSPMPVKNSALAFSWHQHGEGKWEALAYMS